MHPNEQPIEKFYTAFGAKDYAALHAGYAPQVTFKHEVFNLTTTGRQVLKIIDAEYPFQAGRITAHRDHFSVWRWSSQALGPAGMLLGWTPLERAPLGFMAKVCRFVRPTRLTMPYTRAVNAQVRNKVRATARAQLDKFIQAHPAYP